MSEQPQAQVHELVEHLFRHQAGQMLATLTHIFGLEHRDLAEQLALVFACCDPALPPEARVALTLKAVSGFSVPEIARAFLAEEATIAQRLVRAKKRIKEGGITLALPPPDQLPSRLDSVLQV